VTVCGLLYTAVWTVTSGFLTAEQRKITLLVKKQDIDKYIAEDQLETHMLSTPAKWSVMTRLPLRGGRERHLSQL